MRDGRARDERIKQGDLAGAVGDAQVHAAGLAEIASRVAHARAALARAMGDRDRLLARGTGSATLIRVEHYLARLRRDLAAARGEQLRAEARHRERLDRVDAARERLTLARAEREIIERHFAAWRAGRRKLAERRED
jgi:hypothetical protein